METNQFNELIAEARRAQDMVLKAKGRDYTMENPDRLHNFKAVAAMIGVTPLQAWAVYWLKHVFAILNYVKGQHESEPIESRFVDVENYSYLGRGLVREGLPLFLTAADHDGEAHSEAPSDPPEVPPSDLLSPEEVGSISQRIAVWLHQFGIEESRFWNLSPVERYRLLDSLLSLRAKERQSQIKAQTGQ